MARKPTPRNEFVLFNVTYEDGTQRSNRRVPAELLGGIEQFHGVGQQAIYDTIGALIGGWLS